jgi:hypothetical protein
LVEAREFPGSIPDVFIRTFHDSGLDSTSNMNDPQGYFMEVKAAGA